MSYVITNYTRTKANQLGVTVQLSTRKGKKIDVFKDHRRDSLLIDNPVLKEIEKTTTKWLFPRYNCYMIIHTQYRM